MDRNVVAASGFQNPQRILCSLFHLDVAKHRGDGPHVKLNRTQGKEDGRRIVDARIGIDDHLFHAYWSLTESPGTFARWNRRKELKKVGEAFQKLASESSRPNQLRIA